MTHEFRHAMGLAGNFYRRRVLDILSLRGSKELARMPTVFSLAAFPIIVIAYVLLARKEERQMVQKFGDAYRKYQSRVPMFFPHWGDWRRLLARREPAPQH